MIPLFFGTHFSSLTKALSNIGYITPASNHFIISFLTSSCMGGFKCLVLNLWSEILFKMNFISTYPKRNTNYVCDCPTNSLNMPSQIENNISIFHFFSSSYIIIDKNSLGPRKAYHKWEGSELSSKVGSSMIEVLDGGDFQFFKSWSRFFRVKLYISKPFKALQILS